MRLHPLLSAIAALALAGTGGCVVSQPSAPQVGIHLPDKPVLVLPVQAAGTLSEGTTADMNQALGRQLATCLGTRAVFAADLPRLERTLAPGNLWQDGRLALSEIATLAQVAECGTAFVFVLCESNPYAPQSIGGTAVLVDADTATPLAERLVGIDLAHPATSDAYCDYLERTRTFRVGNLESKREDRVHTALLSPRLFRDFVAYATVNDMFRGPANGSPLQLQHSPHRKSLLSHIRMEN